MKKYKSYSLPPIALLLFLWLVFISSCSKKTYSNLPYYQFNNTINTPDYSNLNYWAAHPWKKDLSDSVPKQLQDNYQPDSSADVFFIHPTSLTTFSDTSMNADINNAALNAKTDYSSILYQASVFNASCRIFAPRYRQAHLRAYFENESRAQPYFDLAYNDVKTAFIYYLKTWNHGRPIIIASHSQGTTHAIRLLKEFFDGKPLGKQLVCAYVIGMPVRADYYETLKPCTNASSTGCIVSWRTFKSGYTEHDFIAKEQFKVIVTNPLNWSTEITPVSSRYNQGGILKNFNKIVPHVVNARIHNNILWTSKPNVPGKIFLITKNYHIGDINLFYMNIRENIAERIKTFTKN
jgi:hypothetical protein